MFGGSLGRLFYITAVSGRMLLVVVVVHTERGSTVPPLKVGFWFTVLIYLKMDASLL